MAAPAWSAMCGFTPGPGPTSAHHTPCVTACCARNMPCYRQCLIDAHVLAAVVCSGQDALGAHRACTGPGARVLRPLRWCPLLPRDLVVHAHAWPVSDHSHGPGMLAHSAHMHATCMHVMATSIPARPAATRIHIHCCVVCRHRQGLPARDCIADVVLHLPRLCHVAGCRPGRILLLGILSSLTR